MKKFICLSVLSMVIMLSVDSICYAESSKGKIGFSASIQDLHLDYLVPIWVGEKFVFAPSFGAVSASDIGLDLGIGASFRYYFKVNKYSYYSGLRFGTMLLFPKEKDVIIDYLGGTFFGTEYFLDKKISIGGELQLNMTYSNENSNRFGNPDGININTGTSLFVSFYLK